MKEMICKNYGYKNKSGVRYCQRCGQYLKPKWTLAQEIKSWDFRGLAGVGRRDVLGKMEQQIGLTMQFG